MKTRLFFLITFLISFTACQKDIESPNMDSILSDKLIHAEIEQSVFSKTYIDEFRNVRFQKADQIILFNGSTLGKKYQLQDSDTDQTSGNFYEVESGNGSIGAGVSTDFIVAYYPYAPLKLESSNQERTSYVLKGVNLPLQQVYDGSHFISQNNLPMVSFRTKTQGDILFKNLSGVLKLNVKGTDVIKQISLKGNNHEKISGEAEVILNKDENPLISMSSAATEEIVLDCGEGIALSETEARQFMIVLPPTVFEKGFEVTLTDTKGGVMVMKTTGKKTISRSAILKMAEFTYVATSASQPDLVVSANGVDIPMVKVQGGTFTMGATSEQGSDARPNEKPAHQVTLSDYYIGQFEVTQKLWKAVTGHNEGYPSNPELPVNGIHWFEIARDFLPKLNSITGRTFSLPTEAEWEYAARGGAKSQNFKYSGSNTIDDVAWYTRNSDHSVKPVGQKRANELGLYDMSGNVAEWCLDYWGRYTSDAKVDPVGPDSGTYHVLRGGNYSWEASDSRNTSRWEYFMDDGSGTTQTGFRVVLSSHKTEFYPVERISLNKRSLTMTVGDEETLLVSFVPENATNKYVYWESSDESVVSVDYSTGKVTASQPGTATIRVTSKDSRDWAECKIQVQPLAEPEIFTVNGVSFPMVKVEGGTFMMGATSEQGSDAESNEKPAHEETVSGFYIGQYEVTQELWMAVMGANPSQHQGNLQYPVDSVDDHLNIFDFIYRLNNLTNRNFTLPNEVQWEFAARGGNRSRHYKFSGSNNLADVAWYYDGYNVETQPVGKKVANELGIYDMSGNVAEWCYVYPEGSLSNRYTCRGGYYEVAERYCRVSDRGFYPVESVQYTGIRLVLPL